MSTNDEINDGKPDAVPPEPPIELVQAAERDDPEAAYRLGKFYLLAKPPDAGKAFHWMQRAVELSSPEGINGLGVCYLYGCGVEQNLEKALDLFRQASEKGVSNSFYHLGQCYYYGWGVRKNFKEAMRLTHEAAGKGVPLAVNFLASVYLNSGSKKDRKTAFQYLLNWAEKTLDPDQLYGLAACYLNGYGTKRNDAEAVRLLQLAWSPDMEYLLGWCYLQGRGVEKNLEEANRRFESAAKMECPPAQYEWGCSLQAGRGTPKNPVEGRYWLIRAAEKDYPWDKDAEKNWRFCLFAMCCAFIFWIAIPFVGVAVLVDVVKDMMTGKMTTTTISQGISSIFLLVGPISFWYGIFRSLRSARWGCVLMVLSGIEFASLFCWHWASQPGTLMFNHLPIPLLILAGLVGISLGTCLLTARRTYWRELKQNKREISFLTPVLICSGIYGLSLIVRHYL